MLQKSLPIVAQAIGRKLGVQVIMRGGCACTDGETIILPELPADDAVAKVLANGFIDHEAAHVRFTDHEVFRSFAKRSPLHKEMLNVLEDLRIEKAIGEVYPGSNVNLRTLTEQLVGDDCMTDPKEESDAGLPGLWMLYQGRFRHLGQTAFKAYSAEVDQILRQKAGDTLVNDFGTLLAAVPTLTSTQDAADLAERVIDRLQQEVDQDDQQSDQSGQDPDGASGDDSSDDSEKTGDPSQGDDSDADGDSSGDQPDSGDSADGDSSGDQPDDDDSAEHSSDGGDQADQGDDTGASSDSSDAAQSQNQASQDPQGDNAGGADASTDDDASGGDDSSSQGTADDVQASQAADSASSQSAGDGQADKASSASDASDSQGDGDREVARKALEAGARQLSGDIGQVISDQLEEIAQKTPVEDRVKFDGWEIPSWEKRDAISRSEVAMETRALRTRLQGLIDSQRRDRPVPKSRGRRVEARRLARLRTGDPKVFSRSYEREAPNTAVHILVDSSGSMWAEGRAVAAAKASLAIADALTGIPGVVSAVSAFPGPNEDHSLVSIQDYGQTVQQCAGHWLSRWSGRTPTPSALWGITPGLLVRPESRRIVIVVTDGEPNMRGGDPIRQTQMLVHRMGQAGIEVLGLGIGEMKVRDLFPIWEVIEDPNELAGGMFRMLENRLVSAA